MTRELSLLTALSPEHVNFLVDAWASIKIQALPPGWEVRWFVQEDGPESEARRIVESFDSPMVHYGASRHRSGPAETRNLALAKAAGDVIMVLDADDMLTPGAIGRSIAALDSGHLWCGFAAMDNQHGELSRRDTGYSQRLGTDPTDVDRFAPFHQHEWLGESLRGDLRSCWNVCGRLPFHPATFTTHAQLVWDVGGWPALSRDEDTAVILAISDRHHGFVSGEVNLTYRRHGIQTSRRVHPIDERLLFIDRRLRR